MPEDDDDHGDNRPADMVLDAKVVKMGGELASIFKKRKGLNEEAANIYANAVKLGIPASALQVAVKLVRMMDKDDRKAYQTGVRRVLKALEPAAADLFAEDVERVQKRTERRKERAAKAAAAAGGETPEQQERRLAADLNPRSNPKSGGAGKGRKKAEKPATPAPAGDAKPWPDDTAAALAKAPPSDATHAALESSEAAINAEHEQIAGAEILDHKFGLTGKSGMGSVSDEKPLSQSEQAAEARAKAGLA